MDPDYKPRSSPFYTAINKPPTFFGVRREFAVGAFLLGMVLYVVVSSAIIAVLVAGALMICLRIASRDDLDAIPIFLSASSLPALYDGGRFSPIEVRKL